MNNDIGLNRASHKAFDNIIHDDDGDLEFLFDEIESDGPIVIGMTGYMQSGKTTAANHLVSKYGFSKIAMAKELKIEVASILAMFDLSSGSRMFEHENEWARIGQSAVNEINANSHEYKRKIDEYLAMFDDPINKKKYRLMMQWWGTEYRRSSDVNYWIDRWADNIDGNKGRYVIDDVRFDNEVAMVRKRFGGIVIRIVRPGQIVEGQTGAGHSSENPDTLVSDGTILNHENEINKMYSDLEAELTECIYKNMFK